MWLINSILRIEGKRRHEGWISAIKIPTCELCVWLKCLVNQSENINQAEMLLIQYQTTDWGRHTRQDRHREWLALNWSGHTKHPRRDDTAFKLTNKSRSVFVSASVLSLQNPSSVPDIFYCKIIDMGKGISRNKALFSRYWWPKLSPKCDTAL